MECVEPGAVLPEDLLAYVTGDGDTGTAAHLARCPACAELAAAYREADSILGRRLFRADCPSALTLGELALELLDPEAALAVRVHLALCPHCTDELATLTGALGEDPLGAQRVPRDRLRRLVARLLPAPGLQAALGGVRGAVGEGTSTYEAEGITISLTVEPDRVGSPRSWSLLCLVLEEAGGELPPGVTVQLLRGGELLAGAAVDELGNATLAGLPAGTYELQVALQDRIISIEALSIGPPAT